MSGGTLMYNEIYKKFHEALKIQSGGDENQGIYFMWPNSTNTVQNYTKLFISPKDLSGLSTIQFRLSFKSHKSLEYCCLEIQTFKLHDLGIFFLVGCIKRSKEAVLRVQD